MPMFLIKIEKKVSEFLMHLKSSITYNWQKPKVQFFKTKSIKKLAPKFCVNSKQYIE